MAWPALKQCQCGVANSGKQVGVTHQIGNFKLQKPGLPGAKHFAGAAQFEVFFGDDETIVGLAHDAQALAAGAVLPATACCCITRRCRKSAASAWASCARPTMAS